MTRTPALSNDGHFTGLTSQRCTSLTDRRHQVVAAALTPHASGGALLPHRKKVLITRRQPTDSRCTPTHGNKRTGKMISTVHFLKKIQHSIQMQQTEFTRKTSQLSVYGFPAHIPGVKVCCTRERKKGYEKVILSSVKPLSLDARTEMNIHNNRTPYIRYNSIQHRNIHNRTKE